MVSYSQDGCCCPASADARQGGLCGRNVQRAEASRTNAGETPGYALVAAFTLALGIAPNVAIFTVVNAVLLEPLPYPQANRIVTVTHQAPGLRLPSAELQISPGLVDLYRESSRTLTRMGAMRPATATSPAPVIPSVSSTVSVTPEVFDVLAVRPALGRSFREADALKDAPLVVILTHGLWQSHFGGDMSVVGRRVEVDGVRAEIVGVMPAGFAFPDAGTRLMAPLWLDPAGEFGAFGPRSVARLAQGVTLTAAQQEIAALQRRIPERFPDVEREFLERAGWAGTVTPLRDRMVSDVSTMLWILFGTVGARPVDRRRECGQPVSGSRRVAPEGSRCAGRTRRRPMAFGEDVSRREPGAGARRRRTRLAHGLGRGSLDRRRTRLSLCRVSTRSGLTERCSFLRSL